MSFEQSPGVYYQSVDFGDQAVAPLRTDIAGFVGIASRGPVDTAIPIESWRQFSTWFGGLCTSGYLGYAVRAFFENGGKRCWVVRVASKDPAGGCANAAIVVSGPSGEVWTIRASSEGVWGNALSVTVRERNSAQTSLVSTEPNGTYSTVGSVSGLSRGTLVRIVPSVGTPAWRVVSDVDAVNRRLIWVNPEASKRLPYESTVDVVSGQIQSVDYDITLFESGRLIRLYEGLSLIPEHARYAPGVLRELTLATDPTTGRTLANAPEPIAIDELRTLPVALDGLVVDPTVEMRLTGGTDGLGSLAVYDFVGEDSASDDSVEAVLYKNRGLRVVERVSEVGILTVPDASVRPTPQNSVFVPPSCTPDPCVINPPPLPAATVPSTTEQPPTFGESEVFQIQTAMIDQCERLRDRFAVLDPPFDAASANSAGVSSILEWRSRFDTRYAALYHPWIKVLDPLGSGSEVNRTIPPCGHVAGGYAKSDTTIGVHKAPANLELQWAVGLSATLNDAQHGLLNSEGINVIRLFGGRGMRTMGARTVSSDPSWRYVNVRRLMSMIEKALEISLQWAVFEPNNPLTRLRATMTVSLFLSGLQEAGALAGATASESFFVDCSPDNNPSETRDRGELIVDIGVAPAKPFEFILLRVGRVSEAIEVVESAGSFGFALVGV